VNIQLKERKITTIGELPVKSTFKLYGDLSDHVYMKIEVEGLTTYTRQGEKEEQVPVKVKVPDEKAPVVCLTSGTTSFMLLSEKVEVVELNCTEVLE